MRINNVKVYDLEESIIAAGYPMMTALFNGNEFDSEIENMKYWQQYNIFEIINILNNNKNYIQKDEHIEIPVGLTIIKLSYEDLVKFHQFDWRYNESRGYVIMTSQPRMELHRFVANNPDGMDVDHINRDKNDYRRENLRVCTRQQNSINKDILPTNQSGIAGVYYRKDRDKWEVRLQINKRTMNFGHFKNKEDAIKIRLEAEKEYFGEFAPQRHLFKQYNILLPDESNLSSLLNIDTNIRNAIKNYKRVKTLANTEMGSGHNQFLTGIRVNFDLTFTNKAWVELERYRFIEFVSSQSTMHRLAKFNLKEQYNKYVDSRIIDIMEELKNKYNETKDKEDYLKLLYTNPSGFELTARLTTNYRALKTVYSQRKNHRLPEWREFCKWIETLPMAKELIIGE